MCGQASKHPFDRVERDSKKASRRPVFQPPGELEAGTAMRRYAAVRGCFQDDVAFALRHTAIRPRDLNLRREFRKDNRIGGVASRLEFQEKVFVPLTDRFRH